MPFDHNIDDMSGYNAHMERSMIDKLFFLDKTDAEIFVDFGCANGALLDTINKLFPNLKLVGFDVSEEMIKLAKERNPNIMFTSDWAEVVKFLNNHKDQKSAIVLSSVLHEIYSYLNPSEIKSFWDKVWNSNFNYVIIRDMMVSEHTARPSDPIAVAKIKQRYDQNKLKQWEAQWGTLHDNWSLVHFLLTYRYEANWEREYKENYLPNSLEVFLSMIPHKYVPMVIEHFTLPFVRQTVMKDFGIQLQDRTHLKLILEQE